MVNERQTDTCADVMYRRERQRGCGEAGLDFAPFIPSQDEVDQQMSALDDKLVSKAQEQYANREIYPLDECYQLDGSTFISAEAFEEILGDEQTHYMAWKNGCIDKLSIDYWEMPDVMAYLVERSIAEGDGGECCYTEAQPIDYAEDCAYSPSEMLECLGANWQEQGVADDGLSYALYGHPNINVENVSGSMMVVSTEQPGLSVMVDYRSGIWVVQPFAHDESFGSAIQFGERLAPVEAGLLRPNVYQHFLEAKHAFDYAIAWIENVGEGALDYCGSQEKRSVSEVRFGSDPTLGSDSSTQTSQRSLAMILVTTTPSVDGYTITNYQGIVFGEVVSGVNMFKDLGAGLRNMFGGRSQGYEEELMRARNEAIAEMQQRAEAMGAHAVVGVDIDYEVLGADNGMLMVTASGTAVQIARTA